MKLKHLVELAAQKAHLPGTLGKHIKDYFKLRILIRSLYQPSP